MKAILSTSDSTFFHTASTRPWNAAFLAKARCGESVINLAARRQLRNIEDETHHWQEVAARVALGVTMVGAYVTAIYQIGSF